jgi:uncharacterized protein DUF2510
LHVVASVGLPPALPPGKEPGWYPAPESPNIQLYWDGQAWVARQQWTAAGFLPLPLTPEESPYPAQREHLALPPTRSPALGLTIGLVGVFLMILSFTTLTWIKSGIFATDFGVFHALSGHAGPELTKVYFGWLAVTGFILTTAVAVIAKFSTSMAAPMRAFGAVLGVTFAALTFGALAVGNSVSDVFHYARSGFWAAVVGFICIGAAAVL